MRQGPDYIQFYPTLRCNRSCDFCFNRSMPLVPDISPDDFKYMLQTLKAFAAKTIDIIGGEPTMHPFLLSLIREADARGFRMNISSNGTNIGLLEEILDMKIHVTIGISVNNRATLGHVREFIKKHRPIIKTVFSQDRDIGMVQEILSLKPERFYFIYRDAMDHEGLREALSFHEFMRIVQEEFRSFRVGTVFCSGFIPDIEAYPDLSTARCPAGTTKLGIMPDGSVYPCNLFFGRKDFLLGNVFTDPFETIWHHQALDFFRAFTGNPCTRTACTHHTVCHGGCPAHSLIHSGCLTAPDPRCSESRPSAREL